MLGNNPQIPERVVIGEGLTLPDAAARVWAYRDRVENEAADQFGKLAILLKRLKVPDAITRLAAKASTDEHRHSGLCRRILATGRSVPKQTPDLTVFPGPAHLNIRERALYASLSISCITETLSTALLIQMRDRAKPGVIKHTVREILEDEISHSRIGWAHLAFESQHSDVRWIGRHLKAMVNEAMQTDVPSLLSPPGITQDLSAWGILPRHESLSIMKKTLEEVIFPGLEKFGISSAEPVL